MGRHNAERRYYERLEHKRQRMAQLAKDEASGAVADSDAVRVALIERVHRGEMTLADAQAELKRIQRAAKKEGRPVRADYFRK